jgi:hypothetical protein
VIVRVRGCTVKQGLIEVRAGDALLEQRCVSSFLFEEPNILVTKDDLGLEDEGLAGRKVSGVLI